MAGAQAYPARPVRLMVGYAAGGSADTCSRLIGQWLTERLGQPILVENRPGAGTNIATEAVVKAPPDGYTLLFVSSANVTNASLYTSLSYNFLADIVPVASLGHEPNAMLVHPTVPAKTVPEFIAYAKANADKVTMATGGVGASSHISGEMFRMLTGVGLVHVPYRGAAPALTDLLAGQVQIYFGPLLSAIDHIRAGRLRVLALTSKRRSGILPDVPTVSEFVPDYETLQIYGIGAPKGTPAEIVDRLNKDINAGLADPKIKERFAQLGTTITPGTPAAFGKFLAEETDKMTKVVKFSGAKAD
jgi:tripartite-type tricarboxylate transporter receptor subunit TctC